MPEPGDDHLTKTKATAAGVPNPGSKEALELGCLCPVLDNCHGLGRGQDGERYGWWVNGYCPIHMMEVR